MLLVFLALFSFFYKTIISRVVLRTGPQDGLFKYLHRFIGNSDRILNLGCGDGILSEKIRSVCKNTDVYDIDIIDLRHNKMHCNFSLYDGYDLSRYENNHFDIVLVAYVLHHVPRREQLLGEIMRIGKKILIIEDILHEPHPTFLDKFFTVTHRLCSRIAFKDPTAYVEFWTKTHWFKEFSKYKDRHISYTSVPEKKWFHYVDHGMFVLTTATLNNALDQ